jgi:uncharacterized protein (TIGR02118 family)
MIKHVSILTHKSELTHEEFVDHWENVHGPLALKVPRICRYVQSHITGQHFRPDIQAQTDDVDGIAELWYDSLEDLEASSASPEAKALYADGALIIGKIRTFIVDEKK